MKQIFLIIPLLVVGCATNYGQVSQTIPEDLHEYNEQLVSNQDAPEWVLKGNGAFADNNFYGVGSASGIRNSSLLRITADDRARNDLVKLLALDSSSLMKDYQASIAEGDLKDNSEEQLVENAIKTITHNTLAGVVIIDHWEHPRRNEMFALARLDSKKYEEAIDQVKSLNKKIEKSIRERSNKLHKELEKSIKKKEKKLTELDNQIQEQNNKIEDSDSWDWEKTFDLISMGAIVGLAVFSGSSPQ